MLRFGSLKTRIIVLTTIPLSSLFLAILFGTIHTTNRVIHDSVKRNLRAAGSVFIQLLATRQNELTTMARVTVRDPRFFAAFSIPETERGEEFAPTLEGLCRDFLRITDADFLEVFDTRGGFLAYIDRLGNTSRPATNNEVNVEEALNGYPVTDFYASSDLLVVAAVVPVFVTQRLEAVVRLGSRLDDEFTREVKRLTGADISLLFAGREVAGTFPAPADAGSSGRLFDFLPERRPAEFSHERFNAEETFTTERADVEYLATRIQVNGIAPSSGFDAIIGREIRTELSPIISFEKKMLVAGILAVVITILAGVFLAKGITFPLSKVVVAAAAMTKGQYDYPLDLRGNDEVAYLARSFHEMRQSLSLYVERLKNLDQVKSNFIALAAHELRTPLTIVSGFNELIISGSLGAVPDKIRRTTQHIQAHLSDLNTLVQKILDLTAFEQGLLELNLEDAALTEIVGSALEKRQRAFSERNLRVRIDLPDSEVKMRVDPKRIEQAFLNLVDNAIRFTPDGGSIHFRVTETPDNAIISVKDTGIGISPNELNWIFDKLYESGDILHHSSGKYRFGSGGIGLGLALCKALVEKHGGKVKVKSTLGSGSEFIIILPSVRSVPATNLAVVGENPGGPSI